MKIVKNKTVSYVKGYKAIGLNVGIKKNNAKDMTLVYSVVPAVAAATFTTNVVKAAPVLLDMEHIKQPHVRAVMVNSGNANACTSKEGEQNALAMAETTATCLGIKTEEVLVYSTGIIGVQLPMETVLSGIHQCASSLVNEGKDYAAEGIMTTDLVDKKIFIELELSGKTVSFAGFAKGSGMVHPNMATMLGYIFTDANITKEMLNEIQKESVEKTYNMISVDGDTSTNDTATLVANGCAENPLIDCKNEDFYKIKEAVDLANEYLAKQIARDGEGATKLIESIVVGAKTKEDAKLAAKSIISSSLVKAAMHGADANWGRVICAIGYSGADFDPNKVDITFQVPLSKSLLPVLRAGVPISFDEDAALELLKHDHIIIAAHLHDGECSAKSWGCDLSAEYVRINGSYRS